MPTGGPRPGAGRKSDKIYFIKGIKYDNLKDAATSNNVHKSTITRWCKSEKISDCYTEKKPKNISGTSSIPADELANMTPLDYMLSVMRDPTADNDRRDKMSYYAAPYMHSKGIEKPGKKDKIKEKAKKAGAGKFRPGKAPSKIIKFNNE